MNTLSLGRKYLLIGALAAPIFLYLMTTGVAAQSADARESITLSPATKRYEMEPGQVLKDELTVVNDGDVTYNFIVYGRPYSVIDSKYDPDFNSTPSRADAYRWVSFQKTQWRVEPGESVKIPYSVNVPTTATPGGHYGVLFAETQPVDPQSTAVARKKRVGSLVYATVKGDYKMAGSLVSSSVPWFQTEPPLRANLSFDNTGNSDYEASTTLEVKDIFGNVKHKDEKSYVVLPQTTRDVELVWNGGAWLGLYSVEARANFLDKHESRHAYVLVAPLWVPIVLVAGIAGSLFYASQKRHRKF